MKNAVGYDPALPKTDNVYDVPCPLLYALGIIGGKWKLPILWHLADAGNVRYNALRRGVVGITPMMLTTCLRELEERGLVARRRYEGMPPKVEYALTERGRRLLPALQALHAWGAEQMTWETVRR